jgi:outer membrane protein assembly factor BamB
VSGFYGTLRENAARAPSVCRLTAPLREAWSAPFGSAPYPNNSPFLAADGRLILLDALGHLVALDPASRNTLWRYPWRSAATAFLRDGHLCEWISDEDLHVIDPATGRPSRSIHAPRASQALSVGGLVVAVGNDYDYGMERLYALDWSTGRRLWSEHLPRTCSIAGPLSASEEVLLCTLVDGRTSPASESIVARRPDTGAELWRKPSASISGFAALHEDRVLVTVGGGVRAFAVRDGSLLWEAKDVGHGYLYGDRLYARASGGHRYVIVDARSGTLLRSFDLNARVPASFKDRGIGEVLLVSETHVFLTAGSPRTALLAFTRDSAEFVWSHLPQQAQQRGEAACVDGRLYYQNGHQRLYCLEPQP